MLNQKTLVILLISAITFVNCGKKQETKKEVVEVEKTVVKKKKKKINEIIDLDNKGIGPVKSLKFDSLNAEMAEKGKKLFKQKCAACHKTNKRLIGPAMVGVYDRRSPEWVMNMMLNPTEMLKKDPIAIQQLKNYNNVMMIEQNLSEPEAREIAEFLRTIK